MCYSDSLEGNQVSYTSPALDATASPVRKSDKDASSQLSDAIVTTGFDQHVGSHIFKMLVQIPGPRDYA